MLEIVPLKSRQVLYGPGEPPRHVYFPRGGFLSSTIVMENGAMVEVATIGREGMAGLATKWPGGAAPTNTARRGAGRQRRLLPDGGGRLPPRDGRVRRVHGAVTRYGEAFLGVVMQSTGCNAAHGVEQRLAKWLLLAHDRVEATEFPLTQEFVAMMLGATRQTVTVVAGELQKAGLITYQRGKIRIVDRKGLEAASCECYKVSANLLRVAVARRPGPKARAK